jgi:hypothetical protein
MTFDRVEELIITKILNNKKIVNNNYNVFSMAIEMEITIFNFFKNFH